MHNGHSGWEGYGVLTVLPLSEIAYGAWQVTKEVAEVENG